ncbi:MAG TPA: MerR family transcriptional regulator [Bryobacteraceae bacterium]|nr:MerR family transcriptional regulator [Bryobacteraceae bacterium]
MSQATELGNAGQVLSTGELAKRLKIQRYQLLYMLDTGRIPEPKQRMSGRRVFTETEVQNIEAIVKR